MSTLNKSQLREATKIITYSAELGPDYLARGLSAMHRSARKTSQQDEILALALAYKVVSNPEFIVGNRCAHCARDLEDPKELSAGLCTSDDCPRHD